MFEKHLWKSDILSKDVTFPQVFFKHFASKNQLPGFYISGTLVENGLTSIFPEIIINPMVFWRFQGKQELINSLKFAKY